MGCPLAATRAGRIGVARAGADRLARRLPAADQDTAPEVVFGQNGVWLTREELGSALEIYLAAI